MWGSPAGGKLELAPGVLGRIVTWPTSSAAADGASKQIKIGRSLPLQPLTPLRTSSANEESADNRSWEETDCGTRRLPAPPFLLRQPT